MKPTFSDIVSKALDTRRKNVEPEQRLRRGEGVGYVHHRFSIKGGKSYADLIAENVTSDNVLLKRLMGRK
jgi:hypothetical protein